jgi:TDG/mug DNA glycosylase family protein
VIKLNSFSPIVNKTSQILILGSMPSQESLRKNEYYANPRNQFWRIIYSMFDLPLDDKYENRLGLLNSKCIALWDVIKECYREGSLDSNIKGEATNDFTWLFREYPNIKYVFFNGSKAFDSFKKNPGFKFPGTAFEKLESTSPANTKKFEDKLVNWMKIKHLHH